MTWVELLAAADVVRAAAITADPSLADARLAGFGWATVDHERAELELDVILDEAEGGGARGPWEPIGRDPVLGAGMWRQARAVSAADPELIVLEPDTEGRLAAALARHGEGVAVVYLGPGRAGPGRLIRGGPAWGPHVVIV